MKNLVRILVKLLVLPISIILMLIVLLFISMEAVVRWIFEKEYDDWDREYNRKAIQSILWWFKIWDGKLPK